MGCNTCGESGKDKKNLPPLNHPNGTKVIGPTKQSGLIKPYVKKFK